MRHPIYRPVQEATPTYEPERDTGPAEKVEFDYDLQTQSTGHPNTKTSYGDTVLGPASEENNDMVSIGKTLVTARSGNAHWGEEGDSDDAGDEGEFETIGDIAPVENRGSADPGMPIAKVLLVGVGIFGVWWLLKGRKLH